MRAICISWLLVNLFHCSDSVRLASPRLMEYRFETENGCKVQGKSERDTKVRAAYQLAFGQDAFM